ncbi:piezo-type mechanosensitive ion channel component 2-like isoform X3 [Varroa jacobsoni]|uniref:piezo-type mechanosensitive ion channel component 2-like isoform X3 n=1 Tax=Varroa jacobsoni TaxID=62625 RepID=UPI000BF7243C|nr:piezo-type mechanosensitive ion channel component 2-like isoform X3 [Varroa jacobsoni]
MVNALVASILFRIGLPVVVLGATLFRYNALSFAYLIFLLISPLLSGPSRNAPLSRRTKYYLITLVSVSSVFCAAHIVYQAVLFSINSYDDPPPSDCALEQRLLTLFGLHRLNGISFIDCVRLVAADFFVFLFSILVYVICDKPHPQERNNAHSPNQSSTRQNRYFTSSFLFYLGELVVLLTMAAAGILHASLFSLVYFIAFLGVATWLGCSKTLKEGYRTLRTLLVLFAAFHYIALYIYQLDYSQEFIAPESLHARLVGFVALRKPACNSSSADTVDNRDVRDLSFNDSNWTLFVHPLIVLWFYFSACTMTRLGRPHRTHEAENTASGGGVMGGLRTAGRRSQSIFPISLSESSKRGSQRSHSSPPVRRRKSERLDSNLVENEQRNYDSMSPAHRTLAIESGVPTTSAIPGTAFWYSGGHDDAVQDNSHASQLQSQHSRTCSQRYGKWKQLYAFLQHFVGFLFKGSYVITLIIMMAWSITYHSWLTFVLLLWSCLLWMMPNSRQACLRNSPALVIYAEILLLFQFIYSLNLNDEELPVHIGKINLNQVGFVKHGYNSYRALGIKILYTVVFWLTLRQYVEHKRAMAKNNQDDQPHLYDQLPGRHGSTSTALAAGPANQIIRRLGQFCRNLLVRVWIWVVAVMLFVISLGGDQVVLYRIVYMVLFLFFILVYQFSYRIWIKVMYGFLLTVIIYSMMVLILIYTYQFENFADYWETYLHVSRAMQKDIGLELYDSDPGSLLLKLLTPTIFLIVTIIQLHYFHKDFIRLNMQAWGDRAPHTESTASSSNVSPIDERIQIEVSSNADSPQPPTPDTVISKDRFEKERENRKQERQAAIEAGTRIQSMRERRPSTDVQLTAKLKLEKIKAYLSELERVVWRLLEIHMAKLMFLAVFLLCVYDVCAMHVLYMGLIVIALPLRSLHQFMVHCCALWTAVLLVSKMIYQLKFVDSMGWETTCKSVYGLNTTGPFPYPFNKTIDNREWIGFMKTSHLTDYCKGYIALITMFTLNAMVKTHQYFDRHQRGLPDLPTGVVWPDVTRRMADRDFFGCVKFLINYAFFKFGVEMCLVTMVACIGIRLDVYALLTAFWLCCMFLLRRHTLARLWPFYIIYLCIVIPLQYLVSVGLPPGLCIEYPWYSENDKIKEAVEWLFLPDYRNRVAHRKILVDCFQLILSCSQLVVFNIEATEGTSYPAGSNREIYDPRGQFIGEKPNPIPCFIGDKAYFNRVKTGVFFLFYWVTLAVMYLAGTNRISLFALFYILACFFFLWNGNEFYLKPIKTLLSWWNSLLTFNVAIILLKCILQVLGCVYSQDLAYHTCWLVQLLGIACLKKLGPKQVIKIPVSPEKCLAPTTEAGLLWDGICFGFLLLQKRLFTSYYFHHLIIEILAQQELSSRGAEVIHFLRMEKVKQQREGEREIMEKIRMKMDRIRENQRKQREGEYVEPETHYQAIRSGDYYLFDDGDQLEEPLDLAVRTSREESSDDFDVKTKGLNAVLSNIMKGQSATMVRTKARTETGEEIGDSSGMSAIISIDRSVRSASHSQASTAVRWQVAGGSRLLDPVQPSTVISRPTASTPSIQRAAVQLPRGQRHTTESGTSGLSPTSSMAAAVLADSEIAGAEAQEEPILTWQEKLAKYLAIANTLVSSMLVSATAKLHSFSGGYREVAKLLDKDKELVKQRYPDGLAILTEEYQNRSARVPVYKISNSEGLAQELLQIKNDLSEDALSGNTDKREPLLAQFFTALVYAFYARTEIVCYLGIVYNQISTATLLSLPLPFMVFLWGSLSVPRPSKTFWITIITYTEAIVVVKYLFQFDFFKWDSGSLRGTTFDPPKMLGIEKRSGDSNYALYDLMLLFLVFLHRFVLKSLGLWKDTDRSFVDDTDDSGSSSDRLQVTGKDVSDKNTKREDKKELKKDNGKDKHGIMKTVALHGGTVVDGGFLNHHILSENDDCMDEEDDDEAIDIKVSSFLQGMHYYLAPFKSFFTNLLHPPYQVATDVYAWMFFCDFFNFFVMVFGYWAFGTGGNEEGVTAYFEKNEVPIPFLIMLLAQFGLIVIDRALYLRKYILGKLIFQQAIVVLIHIWMFFALPAISQKSFSETVPPKLWYFTKCVYFLLSAYQIRCGYPTRILGNFFTKKYNYLNYFLFKGYMMVPFLYELRSLMDWIWTDTSMVLVNWLKMEDIFASIFMLKCQRRAEEEYPTPRGAKRSSLIKYGMGGTLLFLIILIIWFPLLLFSLGNTVGHSLPPDECQIQLSIGGYEPLFSISAQKNNIQKISSGDFEELYRRYKDYSRALNFLANYDQSDVVIAMLDGNSAAVWSISPPSREALRKDLLNETTPLELKVKLTFYREKNDSDADPGKKSKEKPFHLTTTLEDSKEFADQKAREQMANMLSRSANRHSVNNTGDDKFAILPPLLPKFIHVPRKGSAKRVTYFESDPDSKALRNLQVELLWSKSNETAQGEWWEVRAFPCSKDDPYPFISNLDVCAYLTVVIFADKVFPQALSTISSYGIVGLYTTFVLLVSRFLRGFIANTSTRIMFDDMPNVDRILQLCMDIYLVRESKELALEEDLFAKLVFLYRSPETLIKWTRMVPPQPPAAIEQSNQSRRDQGPGRDQPGQSGATMGTVLTQRRPQQAQ